MKRIEFVKKCEEAQRLRDSGKTLMEIAKIQGCSWASARHRAIRSHREEFNDHRHPADVAKKIYKKIWYTNSKEKITATQKLVSFRNRVTSESTPTFKLSDLVSKFGEYPRCYLTGRQLQWTNPYNYSFDHIIPVSKGGLNCIDNLGLTCKVANQAKTDLLLPEFLSLCKEILEYNGFSVTKNNMKNNEVTLTPTSTIVNMTKALPPIPDGSRPLIYKQVIPNAAAPQSGKPDPAHND